VQIGVQEGVRTVDVGHPAELERVKTIEDLDPLTHQEHPEGTGLRRADLVGGLERHLESARLDVLAGESQDLGIVVFPARRMLPLPKDPPAVRVAHRSPPRSSTPVCPPASASARATSDGSSTSTTFSIVSAHSGSPPY